MKQSSFIFLMLLILNILVFPFVVILSLPAYLEVSFFDVGQGDSIFIEAPGGYQVLIDGGPNYFKVLDGLSQEMPFYDKEIDLIILSHPESDHMTGLFSILENYKVDNIIWTGMEKDGEKFETWKRLINEEGANIYYANAGDTVNMGDLRLEIINPKKSLIGERVKETNDTAIVAKLQYKDSSFLFTGDISSKIEDELNDIDIDILKVAHHGSKYSTSEDFLKKTTPLVSIIQVGNNSYGHPTEEVLTRLNNFGIKILRNDTNGDIKIVSDGSNYKIITSKK